MTPEIWIAAAVIMVMCIILSVILDAMIRRRDLAAMREWVDQRVLRAEALAGSADDAAWVVVRDLAKIKASLGDPAKPAEDIDKVTVARLAVLEARIAALGRLPGNRLAAIGENRTMEANPLRGDQ